MNISQKHLQNFKREVPSILFLVALQLIGFFYFPSVGSFPKWLGLTPFGLKIYNIIFQALLIAFTVFLFSFPEKFNGAFFQKMPSFAKKFQMITMLITFTFFSIIFWGFNAHCVYHLLFFISFYFLFFRSLCRGQL